MLAVLASGAEGRARIESFVRNPPADSTLPLTSVQLLAPVPRPPKLICIGLELSRSRREARQEIPKVPTIFAKFSNVVIGPGEPIVLPKNSRKPDYEAEFMFVIGTGGRHIAAAGLAAARLRIHRLQRRQRARFSIRHFAVDDGQDLRYVRAHGAVPGERRRNSRSACARYQPAHWRRGAAAFQYARTDLQDSGAGGVSYRA